MRVTKNNVCGVTFLYVDNPRNHSMWVVCYRDDTGHMQAKIYFNRYGNPAPITRLPKAVQAWCDTHPSHVSMVEEVMSVTW